MATYDYDLGVIGAGAAGLTMAAGSARLGARTLLIEKEASLGGDCLHYGCVPSKTLIRTAQVYQQMKQAARFGLPQIRVEPVDFARVAERIRSVIHTIQQHDSVERFCRLGVRVEFGQAAFVDEHTISLGNRKYSARSWVIATGSSPAVPPVPGLAQTPYLTNRDIFSLDRLPASMIILGGGPIAIEMAQAFNRLGTRVAVVQRSGQILTREDKDMADQVMAAQQAEGVEFHLKAAVAGVRDLGRHREVTIRKNEQTFTLIAEALLVAVGRTANVEGLGLDRIGVEYDRQGIKVDARLRTAQPHIYAAGDVNGVFQFTHAAGYEAGIVISNAVFHLPRKANYAYMPWCTFSSPELASIGMNEKAAAAAGIRYTLWQEEFKAIDRALAEGEEAGRVKLLLDERQRPLGIQILGSRAGDLLAEWVAVLNGKVGLATLAAAVHPYPTLGEINKRVAGSVLGEKLFSERVRKGLRFFFQLKGRACEVAGQS